METHSVPLRDITERHAAEKERCTTELRLQRAQKLEAIGALAGGIAHDFNNILAAIGGNLELAIREVPASSPARECLDEIRQASARAKALTRQILAFSRVEPARRRVVLLAPIVAEVARFMRAAASSAVAIEVRVDPGVSQVLADAAQIHQVLVNLCTNACQTMEETQRPGTLSIELHQRGPGQKVALVVRDTGAGMDAATKLRLFEPFFTTKPAGKGTGIGLAVVHEIVRRHDGSVDVESEPGRGSTFPILLPAASEAIDAEDLPERVTVGGGENVLLIDDEPSLVRAIARNLTHLGYRVTCFADPHAALSAYRADPDRFALIVTDYQMPGLQGLTLARELLSIRSDARIVLHSGFLRPEVVSEAAALGIRRTIAKPLSTRELSAVIQEVLREPALPVGV
ncbi:MAG: response regulator [Planctomycetes bacterium]|nr:response regulator [Planctomycetota bacterium]